MEVIAVLYDACVLYPAPVRDLLMHLGLTDLFRPKWTHEIHDEWIRNLLTKRPDLDKSFLERTRDMMNMNVRDCLIDHHHHLIADLDLPDPDDRHILAAAIHASCSIIVTYNLKDFPATKLEPYEIEAMHPDDFVFSLIQNSLELVLPAVQRHRLSLKNPPKSVNAYLETLQNHSLNKTVNALKTHSHLI